MKTKTIPARRAALVGLRPLARLGALLLVLGHASAASSAVNVFHSPNDDGERGGGALILPINSTRQLDLWIERGTAPTGTGLACANGDGDEICAWDVFVELSGDVSIVSWSPEDPGTQGAPAGSMLKINGLVESPAAGPLRLGRLVVTAGTSDGEVSATGNRIVNADQKLEDVSGSTIARVPEPALAAGLAFGLPALAFLRRMRCRRTA